MAADLLDRRDIGLGHHEGANGGVTHYVGCADFRIQASAEHDSRKRFAHIGTMGCLAGLPCSRKNPAVGIIFHFLLMSQRVPQGRGDRLLTFASLRLVDPDKAISEIDLIIAPANNLGVPHGGIKTEHDEQPCTAVLIFACSFQQRVAVVERQNSNLLPSLLLLRNFRKILLFDPGPILRCGPIEQMRKRRHFAIYRCLARSVGGALLTILSQSKIRDLVEAILPQKRDQLLPDVAALDLARGSKGSELSPEERRTRKQMRTGRASEGGKRIREERERILFEAEVESARIIDAAANEIRIAWSEIVEERLKLDADRAVLDARTVKLDNREAHLRLEADEAQMAAGRPDDVVDRT